MMRVFCTLIVAAALPLVGVTPAHARAGSVAVVPDACPPGTIFELTGSGFPAGATGDVRFDRVELGAISSDESGSVRGFFMVPSVRSGPAKVRVVIGTTRGDAAFSVLEPGTPSSCTTTTP